MTSDQKDLGGDTRSQGRYVLITAAHNEERLIGGVLESMISQTVAPVKWVIVSDGSTDRTDELVETHAERIDFITLLRKKRDSERNFGSKARAIRAGYETLGSLDYEFIGVLDADVSFAPDYYERILKAFSEDPELGVAGGRRFDNCNGKYKLVLSDVNSAGGPTQFFRRACYEAVGGYLPLPRGGVDAVAETMARMHGWKVRTVPGAEYRHHRRTGTERGGILHARFRQGVMEYSHGAHPLFELVKCLYRVVEAPYVLGSAFRLAGFCASALRGDERAISPDVVAFLRHEQLTRLRGLFGMSGRKAS